MRKTILITGSTDGIGLETAKRLASQGHHVLLHGRNRQKLQDLQTALVQIPNAGPVDMFSADLSQLAEVDALAEEVLQKYDRLDVLINNAGVFKVANPIAESGFDLRFVVNTFAPYRLVQHLLPALPSDGRVINLSSAAQAEVDLNALRGEGRLNDSQAYAQSKLALTMWSADLARTLGETGPSVVAVNPGSFLASKMVKQAYGVQGNDLQIGADILVRAALSDEFEHANGLYFDNDRGQFADPHPDALDQAKNAALVTAIENAFKLYLKSKN